MATYSLSGTGTQTLTANTVALHVTISTLPLGAGQGGANPADYYGVGFLRAGNATSFWAPWTISGGPEWFALPNGTTRVGYALLNGAALSVAEVFSPNPLAWPLAALPDVALASLADAQVLTYQASSSKWINATAAGGGGGGGATSYTTTLSANATSVTLPASGSFASTFQQLRASWSARGDTSAAVVPTSVRFNGDTGSNYTWIYNRSTTGNAPTEGDSGGAVSSAFIGYAAAATAVSNAPGSGEIWIPAYHASTFRKNLHAVSGFDIAFTSGSGSQQTYQIFGCWSGTAAITSMTFVCSAGNYIPGSTFTVWAE